ncbi:MAG: helix-turn-helix domain-containing protein [Acidimicrobiales bacterium]
MLSRLDHAAGAAGGPSPSSVEALIEAAVERAVRQVLGPHLHKLASCEPAVYTVSQAAQVLQVSEDTVGRMVRRGALPRVPLVDGKVLIPRRALDRLTKEPQLPGDPTCSTRGRQPLAQ